MDYLSRLGDSNWWLGENSLFGRALQTISDSGIQVSAGGMSVGGAPSVTNITSSGMEADLLKYGGLALLVYLIVKK